MVMASLPGSAVLAQDASKPFTGQTVRDLAQALAQKPFEKPAIALPPAFAKLTYDQHRDIRFRTEQSIWRGKGIEFELQLLPMGWLFDVPVEIHLIEDGVVRQLKADAGFFNFGPLVTNPPAEAEIGFSGFRIHGPINRPDYFDEIAVFQGASYFRAVGKGHIYGISARGLAINTARPGGEEFPIFRSFWIERPAPGSSEIVVHALLDSPSLTGAYRFVFKGSNPTTTDVESTLYTRKDVPVAGISPLTSMFLFGANSRRGTNDFRPAVHDSEGLSIINGTGERIWRPLTNPRRLQVSAFIDRDPKGFGLIQRDRRFLAYEDLEAHYERRPSLWVKPVGPWGHGSVELVEIPTDEEIHDNIAAYWRPAEAWVKGKSYSYNYKLYWSDNNPIAFPGAMVKKTRIGLGKKPQTYQFIVDFSDVAAGEMPVANLMTTPGTSTAPIVQPNPEVKGVRVAFELDPKGAETVEMRLSLRSNDKRVSEVWLYRWTRD